MELLPSFSSCYFCGHANKEGFAIRYRVDAATGLIEGHVEPAESYCGFPGILHGGLQAALLDDVMWWAASYQGGTSAVTLGLNTSFAKEAKLGQPLRLIAEPGTRERRKQQTTGRIEDPEGNVLCTATGLYLLFEREKFESTALGLMSFEGCSDHIRQRYGA